MGAVRRTTGLSRFKVDRVWLLPVPVSCEAKAVCASRRKPFVLICYGRWLRRATNIGHLQKILTTYGQLLTTHCSGTTANPREMKPNKANEPLARQSDAAASDLSLIERMDTIVKSCKLLYVQQTEMASADQD
jgi:hypothetical protein